MKNNPIICAVDTTDINAAKSLTSDLREHVGAVKLGLEFFTTHGAKGVKDISSNGIPIFLDLKFHDIPNTVAGAVRSATNLGSFMMTVHASGGLDMLKASIDAAGETAEKIGVERPMIIGVSVLTSLDENDLNSVGVNSAVKDQVLRLAELATKAGIDGMVCSPYEIKAIKDNFANDLKLIVPGIRPADAELGDQKRVMTPKEALDNGADYLVIGRPITKAEDPVATAENIINSFS